MKSKLNGFNMRRLKSAAVCTSLAVLISAPALLTAPFAAAQDDVPEAAASAGDASRVFSKRERLRHEMRRRGPRGGEMDPTGKGDRVGRMGNFLKFVRSYQDAVKDPRDAAGFAILAVRESYKRQGKPEEAVKYLRELLDKTADPHLRNIILFNLKQSYEQDGNEDQAIAVSKQIVEENIKLLK